VFGTYRDEQANYSTCIFPAWLSRPYEAEHVPEPKAGMRLLTSGADPGAAYYPPAGKISKLYV
jgi:hypothetical protein